MTINRNSEKFGLNIGQLQSLVAEGMHGGADWCDLYFEDTTSTDLVLRDGEVNSGGYSVDFGCGIRVLKGEKTGYAYADGTNYSDLLTAARAASSISEVKTKAAPFKTHRLSADASANNFYPSAKGWREAEIAQFVPFLKNIESEIRRRESRTIKVIALLSYSVSNIMMFNSLGELTEDSRPLGSVIVKVIFKQGDNTVDNNVSRSLRAGVEMINDSMLDEIVSMAVSGVDELFSARRPKGGQMPVVMKAGASGILLHEAMGHAFEADFNRKGQSVFTDKMGARICRKGISIIDDGTIRASRGACNFDDEGVPGQKTYMVTDGVLTSYLHDRISASWYGVAPTGNGRRESFRYNPIPRMRTTYMESGSDGTVEDLIASVKKGIYVDKFSNGEVKIGEGDFTFFVKSGSLIENGRLTMPVKDINIIGNGPQALSDIEAVASDLKIDDGNWTCGKEQSVAVSCGIPSVLIKSLTVGGE